MTLVFLALALAVSPIEEAVDRTMAGRQGAAVVLEVGSGRLLAAHRLDVAARKLSRPGSAVKPFTLAALLASGWSAETGLLCRRELRIGGRRLDCTHPRLAAPFDARAALAYSCNFYFAEAAAHVSSEELARGLLHFGLASRTGLAPDEAVGSVRPASSLDERRLQAIGEVGLQVTPLGLAAAYRKLALRRWHDDAALAPVFEGLEACARDGTGRLAAPPGLNIAGKTGTAVDESAAGRHAWFAGYAPVARPEIVVVVFLERGSGGADAAPVARQIFEEWRMPPRLHQVAVCLNWLTPSKRRTVRLPVEDYVTGVLAGEAADISPAETLQALAVAARSYAARFRGRHAAAGFDFCDTTHCQTFRAGYTAERLGAAVEATGGELLWYAGQPAAAYYHQNCGGTTEAAEFVFPEFKAPYLRPRQDAYCTSRGRAGWHTGIRRDELRDALRQARLPVPHPAAGVRPVERTPSGRVTRLEVFGATLSATTFHLAVGRALGWNRLRSAHYEVRNAGDRFVFDGHGSGHGVGLCQAGAARMGEEGRTFRQILDYYYPGTVVGLNAQGFAWRQLKGERVELWSTQPADDQSLIGLAERLLADAEKRSGSPATVTPRLKIYPSVAAFRDATGEPGWVAASTRGRVIRMQPAGVLRSRNTLESTLLHELLHVLIEGRARPGLPLWFREGLVVYLASGGGRVKLLADRYGKAAVLCWLHRGLPKEVAKQGEVTGRGQ